MKYIELINLAADYFSVKGIESARIDAEILLCFAANITRAKLLADLNDEVTDVTVDFFRKLTRLRAGRIPTAYIIGKKEFYGYNFFLNSECLIPRPETEQIIELILKDYSTTKNLRILDICCGPGTICIPLLLNLRGSRAIAADINFKTLNALYTNAENFSLLERIDIIEADVLSNEFYDKMQNSKFDLIVCNPPYISEYEYNTLAAEVKKEPRSALVPKYEQVSFYIRIIPELKKILNKNGAAYFEISETVFSVLKENEIISAPDLNFTFYKTHNGKYNVMRILVL